MTEPLLDVQGLSVEFHTRQGIVRAVQDLDLEVAAGSTVAVVGESGSGKSVTAQSIMGLLESPPAVINGRIEFAGRDLLGLSAAERRSVNGEELAMVFQDSLSALNPVFAVGSQLAEVLRVRRGLSRREAWRRAIDLMERVRIPAAERRARDYPHQFSGGMRQRIMIAMAIALEPRLLIADEPTTALDVTVQAQIMDLLAELQAETDMALILITHDLGVVAEVADQVVVMYAGRLAEQGDVTDLFATPAHPYTRGLLRSMPRADADGEELWAIPGAPPNLLGPPPGCAFAERCDLALDCCRAERPVPRPTSDGRLAACHRSEEVLSGRA
ncbi:ABC transporter ATP-binding protein [Microlunatus sp. GCM10028923]|uniref:ABC transporter ATP-binding protein n=1 Tax=Microlunatus sp. GCM10028923 TaxID=3273400 RepID=UPI00361BD0D1